MSRNLYAAARAMASRLDSGRASLSADDLDDSLRRIAQTIMAGGDPVAALKHQVDLLTRRLQRAEMTLARLQQRVEGPDQDSGAGDDTGGDDDADLSTDNVTTYGPTNIQGTSNGQPTTVTSYGGDVSMTL